MKRISLILLIFVGIGCQKEAGLDCFKKQGKIVSKVISVEPFNAIEIQEGIELSIKEASQQKVTIETGKNFIDDIDLTVKDDILIVKNENTCQMLRNYHAAKITVETPDLKKIHSISQYNITSQNVLHFPQLTIESGLDGDQASGIFDLKIDNNKLKIQSNLTTIYRIEGKTKELELWFWGGNSRFEGDNFKVDDVSWVYQRSTNDIILFPINKLKGRILSTGNIVLKNVPDSLDVEQINSGHLVYPE